ncbi:hypothetical protein Tsubulata_037364 [Turnera subulata]|uniref:Protein kinase domain-containing protein n=1 Tax=Turnera subulata TaxID=218843 RepID=A0A9Q0JDS1_9ROSI|nr:hypothetical protein Tsubulata_037364 [Turnera subulata]
MMRREERRLWVVLRRMVVVLVLVGIIIPPPPGCRGQQEYVNNHQNDCYNDAFNSSTLGYKCSPPASSTSSSSSCQSYLTFRAIPPYTSPALIAYLLTGGGDPRSASLIASLNNISSDTATIPANSLVVVPLNCSCYGNYYQHNTSYTLKSTTETYFTVANNTYQGLTTCQTLMAQNPWDSRNLSVGLNLEVPLRCACPSPNQTAAGFRYLLTYLVNWGDSVSAIASRFRGAGATEQSIRDANRLSPSALIFPFTPLLVPLTVQPSPDTIGNNIQVPPISPTTTPPPNISTSSSNNHSGVYVGVGVAAAAVLLIVIVVSVFLFKKSRNKKQDHSPPPITPPTSYSTPKSSQATTTTPGGGGDSSTTTSSNSWSLMISSSPHVNAIGSLTLYKFQDLEVATSKFSEANRIKGSVYKGSFNDDAAAVKVIKGDHASSSREINILKMINHSNILRLSGFCLHQGNTYLVYEYAHNGSLWDALHPDQPQPPLGWKQRIQIAYNVADALNYLHNYTSPPYIHNNIKSSHILLDTTFTAKLSNFGQARMLSSESDPDQDGGAAAGLHQLTRHVVGTQGYMAPEYIENGLITPKLDVFAFGVLLLELLSAKEAAPASHRKNKNNTRVGEEEDDDDELPLYALINRVLEGNNVRDKLRAFLDPNLADEYPLELAFSMAQLAKNCTAPDLNARPSISQVFAILSKILSSSLDWDPSDELQHSSSFSGGR